MTPVFWLGEFLGQRSLAGYSPWDCKDTTEQLLLWCVRAADARETAPWRQEHKRLTQLQPGEPQMPGGEGGMTVWSRRAEQVG